jgi:hypothetical protein
MFDMKVAGAVVRGVSMIYATTVGNEDATASVIIAPDADQVNISICPGVSSMIWLRGTHQTEIEGTQLIHTQRFRPFSLEERVLDRTWS